MMERKGWLGWMRSSDVQRRAKARGNKEMGGKKKLQRRRVEK